jgi:diguanylate cyclase (GGDEF)-like protein/PAS domain S-box-containing protein
VAELANQRTDAGLSEQLYRRLVDHSPDAICVIQDARLVYVNAVGVRWMAAKSSRQLLGKPIADFVDRERLPALWSNLANLREAGDVSAPTKARFVRFDGGELKLDAVAVLTSWEGEPAYQVVFRDVGGQESSDGDATDAEHFEAVVQRLDDGVLVVRNNGTIKSINPAAMRILDLRPGILSSDFVKRAASLPVYDADGEIIPAALRSASRLMLKALPFTREVFGVDLPNGERKWLLTSARLLNPDDLDNSDMLISFSDITTQRAEVEDLMYQANHDPLTGLPNRAYVLRRIRDALSSEGGAPLCAVMFIDLDDLKTTNDTLGHEAGDDLLQAAAVRLRRAIEPGDVVGRLGGDEFVVLMFGGAKRRNIGGLANRVEDLLAEPLVIAGTEMPIRASVGTVKVNRSDPRTAVEILRDADRAMYKAKRAGRGSPRRWQNA